ncbi:hypothetical protein [Polyangium fumosum]|uniref:Uncharacterized protein n=1 Tax=Polyangium fumosum TaxID=889272 RepID=A0A4U1J277_9BACT|nr:hypothetical protein [Polyangium fumosum]TKD01178.1 hypothetical protein E8A74_31760 [Polyangium fumosum]
MTTEQQDATKRVGKLVRVLAEQPLPPQKGDAHVDVFLPLIDEKRLNHVILLDGGRGSGKTALLVTHMHVWSFGVRREAERGDKPAEPDKELQNALEPLGQVVPVGLLDLQPLPRATNLLLYLVTRFKRIVQVIESATGQGGSRTPWHGAEPEGSKSATEWRRFLQAAAAGWDGSLKGRRAHADPETYAVELEQAEEQRLDVVSCFRRFMDALVEEYRQTRWHRGGPPLFVMGIDDADMNVPKAAELVDVVRTLWHPRVAFLLTGDTELFRAALHVQVEKELAVSGKGAVSSAEPLVRSLPRNIYDKVVPPLHRLELKALRSDERYTLLDRWFSAKTKPEEQRRISRARELFAQYATLKVALPERLRPLQDFALWVPGIDIRGKGVEEGVVEARVLHYLWKYGLDVAWPALALEDWVTEDDERRVVVRINSENKFRFSTTLRSFGASGETRVEVADQWHLGVYDSKGAALPEALAACLLPLLDYGRDSRNRHVRSLVAPSIETNEFAVVMARMGEEFSWISWPTPVWPRFADYIAFSKRWSKRLETLAKTKQETVGDLARAYLDAVLGGEPKEDDDPWRSRAERLQAIWDNRDADPALKTWASLDAPLLAAPESGLDAENANAWLEALFALFSEDEWKLVRVQLMERRRARILAARGGVLPWGDVDQFDLDAEAKNQLVQDLREIRAKSPNHTWHALIERDPDTTFRALLRRMDRISVPGDRSAGTLTSYLTPTRIAELRSAPVDMLERMHNALEALARQQGAAGDIAIERLWRIATRDAPAALQEAVLYRGRLELDINKAFKELGRPALQRVSTGNLRLDSGSTDKMALGLSRGELAWSKDKKTAPYLHALFRMVWDIESDLSKRDLAPLPAFWPLAGGVYSDIERYPWPAAVWPRFLDWERLLHAWNEKVVPAIDKLADEAAEAGSSREVFGDSAAYWYVTTIEHFSGHRCDLGHINFAIASEVTQWENSLKYCFSQRRSQPNPPNAHRRAFYDFLDHIGLLAAPESGLSQPVAAIILQTIPDLTQRREELAKLRRERLTYLNVPAPRRDAFLQTIDEGFPTHPWITAIEEPLRNKTP